MHKRAAAVLFMLIVKTQFCAYTPEKILKVGFISVGRPQLENFRWIQPAWVFRVYIQAASLHECSVQATEV